MTYKKSIIIGLIFFGLIVLTALVTFYFSLGECDVGYHSCDDKTVCLPQKLVCDFNDDCKDKSDEDRIMCGNLYGSNEIANLSFLEGRKIYRALEQKYNFTTYYNECALNTLEIPNNCECTRLIMLKCRNLSFIPKQFPNDIVRIDLAYNGLSLDFFDTFGQYKDLSLLDLRHNNISYVPSHFLYNATNLRKLYLQNNQIVSLPHDFFKSLNSLTWLLLRHNKLKNFDLGNLSHLINLQYLELSYNQITLESTHFPLLPHLIELFLDNNLIRKFNNNKIYNLKSLHLISIRNNLIQYISESTFHHAKALKEIRLSGNPVKVIATDTFVRLKELNALYLDYLQIPVDEKLLSTFNVSFLSLKGIPYEKINFNAIEKITKLEHIVYKKFSYCSNTPKIIKCFPKTDGISSTSDLLDKQTLRYAVWFMALLSCIGNVSVLWGRLHDENRSVSLVIRNLAFSDMIMGIYLMIIAYTDTRFRNVYHENSGAWIKSWQCAAVGILAVTSTEVSILILTFMSIERFLLISDPFGHHKLDTKNVILSLYIIWLVGFFIAILPVILFHSSTKFYNIYNKGTCFPFFIEEVYSTGWIYSAIIFLGINLILLVLIATLYTVLLFSIFQTRRATSLNFFDCELAIRFFFIVLTDLSCWTPIIILKLLVLSDVEVSGDVYSWLVIFVLPLNSAVNPLLFTYTTPKYRDKIFSAFRQRSLKKQDMNSNQITADESQTKVSLLLYNSNGSISKWKFFNK